MSRGQPCAGPAVGHNILRFHDKLASCAYCACTDRYQKDNKPMKIFRGFHHPGIADACALTIGNFDGVHRGHQAMLALLNSEAAHRGWRAVCSLSSPTHATTLPVHTTSRNSHQPGSAPCETSSPSWHAAVCSRLWCYRLTRDWPHSRPRPSLTRCWCAAWVPATCWWATISALAASERATTPCWTRPGKPRAST